MKCGFCLPACPTYRMTGKEAASPRGRISLMRGVAEGKISPTEAWADQMDFCLGCRACETACPAGVKYGRLIEQGRALAEREVHAVKRSRWEIALHRVIFDGLFPRPWALKSVGALTWLYQKSGGPRLMHSLAQAGLFPKALAQKERMLPKLPPPWKVWGRPTVFPAVGATRYRVGLLTGCVMDIFFSPVNASTIRVLQRNGCDVHLVPGQACCGALHAHTGDPEGAKRLARKNITTFMRHELDVIINNAAGCGAMVKEYAHLLHDDPQHKVSAETFASKVRDVTEFLASIPREKPTERLPIKVTYQDPCHLAHGQGIREAPRTLLQEIPGLQLIEMAHPDWCCGSAGIYNVVRTESSLQVLGAKMEEIQATGCDVIVTANPGCLAQLMFGAKERGMGHVEVLHVVEVLDRAYRQGVPA